jgi:hypothetical protein
MKKIIKLCLVATAIILTGCDPDDGNTNNTTDSIVGKWQLTSIVFGVGTTEEPLDECDRLQIYHFKEDNNLELYFNPSDFCGSTTYTLSYTFEDNELTTEYSIGGGATYIERNTVQQLNTTTLKYQEVWNSIDGNLQPESRATYTYMRVD